MKKQYLILGIMTLIIAMGITVQVKTVQSWDTSTTVQSSTTENKLKDSVLKAKEKYETTYSELESVLAELETVRENVSSSSDEASSIQEEISELNKVLGYTEITRKWYYNNCCRWKS